MTPARITILDRYVLRELSGPFLFGLSAFTLIFAATQLINIGRVVSETHAPLWAAVEAFLWQLPPIVVLAIPMAMLLGTLLAMQRLSGDSEITAMKAGGISFLRIVAPLLAAGAAASLVTLALQERVVPFAREQFNVIQNTLINQSSAFASNLNVSAPLPGGGSQITFARACAANCAALLGVTLVQYDRSGDPSQIVFADRAVFTADTWTLDNARVYRFQSGGESVTAANTPSLQVSLGENPAEIVKRVTNNNPEDMNRAEIAQIIRTGQLSASELRKYTMVFQEKLATPFACFVFTLIAVPYGIRAVRGGGSTSLGFGLAVLIVFIYYVVLTIFSYVGEAYVPLAPLAAWMPNIIFTIIGARRLYRAAMA
ncbi:MAG TPA: LptF/LptG family permease [Candidatus Baltobacteraceae bacterium]|nr:LptF/LptG family permease [Candidatus Baltobacteraceae bacterium]